MVPELDMVLELLRQQLVVDMVSEELLEPGDMVPEEGTGAGGCGAGGGPGAWGCGAVGGGPGAGGYGAGTGGTTRTGTHPRVTRPVTKHLVCQSPLNLAGCLLCFWCLKIKRRGVEGALNAL